METLEIINFLTIKEADIVIKKMNIIIGSQATGKSIIAKLIYLFQSFLSEELIGLAYEQADHDVVEQRIINNFETIFPKYGWLKQDFSIVYMTNNIVLTINHDSKNDQQLLRFTYSDSFAELMRQAKSLCEMFVSTYEDFVATIDEVEFTNSMRYSQAKRYIRESTFGVESITTIFIPAGRAFFATIQKNIFSLLASNINLDTFIKKFGYTYEKYKSIYEHLDYDLSNQMQNMEDSDSLLQLSSKSIIEKILIGEYRHQSKEDWIYNPANETMVNLSDASSGQQESLPMLLILSAVPFSSPKQTTSFFIEEPEAHLFPSAQKSITELFSLLYNGKNSNFFITTHSPYILTALNVLIKAGNIYNSTNDRDVKEKINAIVDKQLHIKFEDVAAYTIKDGILEGILNEDLQIIGSSIIDSVSDEFESEYNALLDLEYE